MTIPSAARRSCHKRSASVSGPSSAEVVMPNRSIGGRERAIELIQLTFRELCYSGCLSAMTLPRKAHAVVFDVDGLILDK
jgi:hypothetical protein